MWTLQLYVTRELLKTFALAAVGLTLVLSLCGAMSTILKVEVPTALTVLYILWLIQPMVLAVTLPVSALFACAIVYGRLAADNEFDACRASGVNIHRLLAPAMALGLFMAAFAFVFSNYVIPKAAMGIVSRVQSDISKFAYQALKSRGYFKNEEKKKGEVQILHAGKVHLVQENGKDVLLVRDAAFLKFKKDELDLCATAKQGRADFLTAPATGDPVVETFLEDFRAINIGQREVYQESRQAFGSRELPKTLFFDPKWLPLGDLLAYRRDPTRLPTIRPRLAIIRQTVRDNVFYKTLRDYFSSPAKPWVLEDENHRYEIRAETARIVEDEFVPELKKVTLVHTWSEEGGRRTRTYKAGEAVIRIDRNYTNTRDVILIGLRDGVSFTDSATPGKWHDHNMIDMDSMAAPADLLGGDRTYTDSQLLGFDAVAGKKIRNRTDLEKALTPLGLGPQVEKTRMKTLFDLIRQKHQIVGTLHSRMSLCASALVTILLAAALGIIFRNGQFLTAFAISFLPALAIVAMNMLGRRQAESPDPNLHAVGVSVIWAGIVLLAVVDLIVLTRYLRR